MCDSVYKLTSAASIDLICCHRCGFCAYLFSFTDRQTAGNSGFTPCATRREAHVMWDHPPPTVIADVLKNGNISVPSVKNREGGKKKSSHANKLFVSKCGDYSLRKSGGFFHLMNAFYVFYFLLCFPPKHFCEPFQ